MKKYLFITIALLSSFYSCNKSTLTTTPPQLELKTKYEDVFNVFIKNDDKLYVVNFWATWCKPCVEELPEFIKINNEYKSSNDFKMILVSLDKATDIDSNVKSFIDKNQIDTDVYVLSDNKRMNEWIPKINPHWSGSIPATIMYKNGKQLYFKEGVMTYDDLKQTIDKFK